MNISARSIIPNSPASHALTMRERLQARIDDLGLDMLTQLDLIFASKRLPQGYLRFQGYAIINHRYLVYQLDPRRLGNLSISDLLQPAVTERLSAVARKTVEAKFTPQIGLTYHIALSDESPAMPEPQAVTLPKFVAFDNSLGADRPLSIPFGVTAAGPQAIDLTTSTHIAVAGASQSGKSSWTQAALGALALHNTPDQVQFAIIDPKGEFVHWYDDAHLFAPAARTNDDTLDLLDQIVELDDRRRVEFESVKARNYRQFVIRTGDAPPYIIILIDEFVDLAADLGSQFQTRLKKLATKTASHGIRLIVTTASPKTEVIDSTIRGQCDVRICFRVNEAGHSRAILPGYDDASRLPNIQGRFMAMLPGSSELVMGQGYYISDEQLDRITTSKPASGQVINQPAAPEPRKLRVSEQELEWLRWCAEQGGLFSTGRVHEHFEIPDNSRSPVRSLAARLLREQWLIPPARVTEPRRFSDELRAALEAL